MQMKKRLFIALTLPPNVKEHIAANIIKPLKKDIPALEYESQSKLHITLSFIGWTKVGYITIAEVLRSALNTYHIAPITITIDAIEGFYGPRFILYLKVKNTNTLSSLHSVVTDSVSKLGFSVDSRPFIPHCTISRSKKIHKSFQDTLLKNIQKKPIVFPKTFVISQLSIMQSRQTTKTNRYKVLESIPIP